MERQWMTLDQIKVEYASNDYNPELLLQNLLRHVEASPASVPADAARFNDGWTHPCNALCMEIALWIERCPHCGRPAPKAPTMQEDKP